MPNVKKNIKKKAKSSAKRKLGKLHPATVAICILALALGICAGVGGYILLCAEDCFVLNGEKNYTLSVGDEPLIYVDQGVKIIEFGKDISEQAEISSTNMTETENGKYVINTSVPGEYYIIYTVDSPKYQNIQRVRTITVTGGN